MDLKIKVSWHQKQMLNFLAERGGSSTYRFGVTDADTAGTETPEAKEKKIEAKRGGDDSVMEMRILGLITINYVVGVKDTAIIKLTSIGTAILDAWIAGTPNGKVTKD